jgi:hypothetical protein
VTSLSQSPPNGILIRYRKDQACSALLGLGLDAMGLLRDSKFKLLAANFGYALALGRDPEAAIRHDLAACLGEAGATSLAPEQRGEPVIKYFQANDPGLVALVECVLLANNGVALLLELVLNADGYVTIEQISLQRT